MTRDHDTKRAIRARMKATGERYTAARSALVAPPATQGGTVSSSTIQDELAERGFVVIRSFATGERLDRLVALVDEIITRTVAEKMEELNRRVAAGETGFIDVWKGEPGVIGERVSDHPDVAWLLGDERLRAFITPTGVIAFATLPGYGHEGLHQTPHDGYACALSLSRSRRETGGFRAIPGSHRMPEPQWEFGGAMAPHPDEVRVETDPGDLLVYDALLWKSGTFNGGTEPSKALAIEGDHERWTDEQLAHWMATGERADR